MTKLIVFSMIFMLIASIAIAAPGDTLWTRTYGGVSSDSPHSVQQTTDGGYIIAGETESFGAGDADFYLVKTDASGDTIWTRTYGGVLVDQAQSVQQTADGGYIIAGETESFGAGNSDFYLIKTDSSGDTLWTRTYGGAEDDRSYSVQQTTDGGYILGGGTYSFSAGSADFYLIKTDSSGDTLWTRTYGGSLYDYAYSVQQTTDGGYIIAGETGSYGAGNRDSYLIKTDSSGDTLWTQTYGGASHDIAESVQQTTDGGYILGGYTESYGAGNRDFYLIKTDSSGDTLWTRTYGGAAYDYAESVQQTTDGGYIMTGYTSSFGAGGADCYLIKTDSSGDTLWTRTYGGAIYDMAYSVQQTTDGGYIVAGGTNSFGPGNADFYLVKVEGAPYYLDLSYVPDDFIFQVTGDSTVLRTFEVYSVGVTGYVKPLCDSSWVSFDPDSVEISHGDTVTFTATFDATGMDYNVTYETEIHFESNVIDLEDDSIHVEMTTNQPIPITIGMIPDNPPVVVAPGDSFTYEGILHNNFGGFFDYPDPITVWINVEHRNIIIGPIHRFNDLTVGPRGESYPAVQYVHSEAVPGEYGYIAYCSPNYPEIMDSCYFTVTITEGSGNFNRSWELYGWGEDISGFENLPAQFALMQNYPNPFNATTTISFDIVQSGNVNLSVYNLAGQKIESLVDGRIEAGEHSITWDASTYSSGVYFYKLTSEGQTFTKRMTLMK